VRASASGHDTIYSSTGATLKGTDVYTGTTTSAPSTSGGKEQLANPAIDPSLSFVYHVGTDGCVHKYSADLASEYLGPGAGTPGGSASGCFDGTNGQAGWPQLLTKFTQAFCTARAGLTVATSGTLRRLYAGVSCNDSTFMDGNVTTIDQNGNQTVFNVNCANQTKHYGPGGCNVSHVAGVWSRAGVLFDPITQRLFATTGDGDFTPDDLNTPTWGYSFLALNPNGTGHSSSYYASYPIDSFTPSSWGGDEDLGSTNALIVNVYNPTYPTLAIVSGGDGVARVLNASNLGGAPSGVRGTELTNIIVPSLQGTTCNEGNCKPTSPMATWTNPADSTPWVFIREPNGVNALAVAPNYGGKPFLYEGWPNPIATTNGHGGLFVANNVLYWSDSMGLHAADPTTGVIKWTDSQNVATGFSTPVVVNGVLYFQGVMYTIGGVAPSTSDVPWVNLAEGRPTYQSTIYGSWTSDLAVNGSTDGNFFHNSAFHTYNGGCSIIPGRSGGPCWKVDLGGTHTVKQVVLYNRTDCCQQRLSHFWIGGHNANGYFMASDQSNFVGSSATAVVPIDLNISTDQIVVQLGASGGDNYLHLAEVQVLGN
jgi:hypothetical protein